MFIKIMSLFFASIVFATPEDGVPVLTDNPTEEQMELVRKGAQAVCENISDTNQREQCVGDYYIEHNLDEEPSCD